MTRVMVIPAAGSGSRLGSAIPKAMYPVLGQPMIGWIMRRYAAHADRFVVVVSPSNAPALATCRTLTSRPVDFVTQERPTGMLDAILLARGEVFDRTPDEVWITWCDQVAVSGATVDRVAEAARHMRRGLVMPTVMMPDPYIHWDRDPAGTIVGVRQRREGDVMPAVGEGDIGLFCLSGRAYLDLLPRFAEGAGTGGATHERNFLPFVPWVAGLRDPDCPVLTVPAVETIEAVGINDLADLARVEAHLRDA